MSVLIHAITGFPGFEATKDGDASTRFIRYRHLLSQRNMFLAAVIVSAILAAPPVISGTVLGAFPSFADGGICESLAVGELAVSVACGKCCFEWRCITELVVCAQVLNKCTIPVCV